MRFRPEQHLRRAKEIRAVREQGRRIDCRAFMIWWKPRENPGSVTARVCVIASTNAVGHAVLRNRAKRRLREIFRQQQTGVPAGCDLLLIVRAATNHEPMPELARRFAEACERISAAESAESGRT